MPQGNGVVRIGGPDRQGMESSAARGGHAGVPGGRTGAGTAQYSGHHPAALPSIEGTAALDGRPVDHHHHHYHHHHRHPTLTTAAPPAVHQWRGRRRPVAATCASAQRHKRLTWASGRAKFVEPANPLDPLARSLPVPLPHLTSTSTLTPFAKLPAPTPAFPRLRDPDCQLPAPPGGNIPVSSGGCHRPDTGHLFPLSPPFCWPGPATPLPRFPPPRSPTRADHDTALASSLLLSPLPLPLPPPADDEEALHNDCRVRHARLASSVSLLVVVPRRRRRRRHVLRSHARLASLRSSSNIASPTSFAALHRHAQIEHVDTDGGASPSNVDCPAIRLAAILGS
ncbi:hypothetical protein Purlil1_8652 [Purpureocillium lilacinum]|uniref:Uncharacterized protein n=1 Tax=Purpureocillium lilacinum TaxID=33203 RepID=A0ABR0BTA1_PURLI|nr:hypothetical protein Purlil1_8652 [Purpureocillium lilacinum]